MEPKPALSMDLGQDDSWDGTVTQRVNVGAEFQAELPALRDRPHWQNDEEGAALVWKPWGDIESNPETQRRVTKLLTTACSGVVPAGRGNAELALHCLHQTQGNILHAKELLCSGGPGKLESHPLADYHYTGLDTWTAEEEQLFRMAFSRCRKDFYRIQKKVQTKSVAQCVEYYYTWKKKLVFDRLRAKAKAQRRKAERDQPQHPKEKAVASPRKCRRVATESTGTPSSDASQPPSHAGSGDALQGFPCPECGRVFAKINGRNAHMKRHCPEEDLDYLRKVRWPLKRPKTEPKAEESRMLMAFESGDSPVCKRQ